MMLLGLRLTHPVAFACLLLMGALNQFAHAADSDVKLKVMTYNIHHGEGTDGRLDLERIAKVIRSCEPDLVALQEVDQNVPRSGNVDQPAELAKLTGMHVVFGGNLKLNGGLYGNCILSRHPITRSTNHALPAVTPSEPRGLLEAEISIPALSRPLRFYCTHFDHQKPEENRMASVKFILELSKNGGIGILAGDLNALPSSGALEQLRSQWSGDGSETLLTFPAEKPRVQIDYVLSSPPTAWKVLESQVPVEEVASDHRPLVTTLMLQSHP